MHKFNTKNINQLIKSKGGKCIAIEKLNYRTYLTLQCSKNHIWKTRSDHFKNGHWCPKCASNMRGEKRIKYNIEDLKKIASEKNGYLLSNKYTPRQKLIWKCNKGHIWSAVLPSILLGTWCKVCSGNSKPDIKELIEIALLRKGELLSNEYINAHTKLKWKCENKHIFFAAPTSVKSSKTWCVRCAGLKKKTIIDMKKLAKYKNGKFLSNEYINTDTKYYWECINGHIFFKRASEVNKGGWCPHCIESQAEQICRNYFNEMLGTRFIKVRPAWLTNESGNRLELDGFSLKLNLAFEYQGRQHYENVDRFTNKTPYESLIKNDLMKKKLCELKGINLIVVPHTVSYVKMGKFIKDQLDILGIPVKKKLIDIDFRKFKIFSISKLEELKEIAKSRGGDCLSSTYINKFSVLEWKCKNDHTWFSKPQNILQNGWCTTCSLLKRNKKNHATTFYKIINKAKKNKIECQDKYQRYLLNIKDNKSLLNWKCSKGHEWKATLNAVYQTPRCNQCRIMQLKQMRLNQMKELASLYNGKCISDNYINVFNKLAWKCANGHIWQSLPANIEKGRWCKECSSKTYWISNNIKKSTRKNVIT